MGTALSAAEGAWSLFTSCPKGPLSPPVGPLPSQEACSPTALQLGPWSVVPTGCRKAGASVEGQSALRTWPYPPRGTAWASPVWWGAHSTLLYNTVRRGFGVHRAVPLLCLIPPEQPASHAGLARALCAPRVPSLGQAACVPSRPRAGQPSSPLGTGWEVPSFCTGRPRGLCDLEVGRGWG